MRSTGYEKPYKALWSAVIGCFSTAVIGAFPSFFQLSRFSQLSCCCVSWSWASMLLEFNSTIPVDVVRVKSYVNRPFDLACVPTRITINKLYLIPNGIVPGVVGALWNRGGLGTGESDISVMFLCPVFHRSSSLADVNFAAFTGYSVNNAVLFFPSKSCIFVFTITTIFARDSRQQYPFMHKCNSTLNTLSSIVN